MNSPSLTISSEFASRLTDVESDFSPFLVKRIDQPKPAGRFAFLLLLLALAALLVRPADLFPGIEHWPIYQSIILLCILFSIPRMMFQLRGNVRARAVTLLLICFGGMVVASQLLRGNTYQARIGGFEFFKIIIFYLLMLSSVDSVKRLKLLALALIASTLVLTTLSVLEYESLIDLPALESIRQADVASEGGVVRRLVGTGIFNDPNDFALMLVVAIGCCAGYATSTANRLLRLGWWIPTAFFVYAIAITFSRGGMMALVGGSAVAIAVRFGIRRAMMIACVAVPAILIVASGRQTHVDLDSPEDTFLTRLDAWNNGLTLFKQSPLLGAGQDQQVETFGKVAHNTYLQNFAELGIIGGACFLGMIGLSMAGVLRIDLRRSDPTLLAFRPYLAGAIAGYAIGLLSLSRGYTISTYLVISLAAVFINLAPRRVSLQLDAPFLRRLAFASVVTILAAHLIVRFFGVHD